MIRITFSSEEIDELHYERFHHPHPRVQRKMEALYLKSQKYPHNEITKLLRQFKDEMQRLEIFA